ncbi:2-oxo acid dehydrogenase subunit E2 [Catellatospora chokoriensis]|uniref:Dihydrolipoamide acetyltransferase component of pyruvate dehydrogenase complex n=1 Tax=Catellatospora chokoriensis TaxID=310353 RepID=A0A8J3KCK3_9ACTN|nr:2-oxo acid dehydrogenase subunit E2 [Catellatospora chokoriensis]GIF94293.1 acetyltransferase component of pyruvate dehydrogenase complex [Catellatospora chokoriensis]
MASLLLMPKIAAEAAEVVLCEWLAAENADLAAGDPVALVETDKAVLEVVVDDDTVLLKVLVAPGESIDVGAPIALLGSRDESGLDHHRMLQALGVAAAAPEPDPAPSEPGASSPASSPVHERTLVSPLSRALLSRAGLTSDGIVGTGPGGRIVRRDVETHIAARRKSAAQPTTAGPTPQRTTGPAPQSEVDRPHPVAAFEAVAHTRIRRAVAARLTGSKQSTPHFYLRGTCSIDRLLAVRAEINSALPRKVSVNDLVIKAAARAHTLVPDMNVIWTEDALHRYSTVDIAVAVASTRGLVTPVLRNVDAMTVSQVAQTVTEHVDAANRGRLRQDDVEGGTFSVTNLGMHGVEEFAAIINPPQSAILAVGMGRPEPHVHEGTLTVATRMRVVLSADHRAIDGVVAAHWMREFIKHVEAPALLLLNNTSEQ